MNVATFVEQDCTIEHEGRKFEAGGTVVTADFVIGYPKFTNGPVYRGIERSGVLNDWHGNQIGTCRVLSTWRTPRSYVSSTMSSIECFVNGVRYVGRGAGDGMLLRAKRSTRQA